MRPVTRFGPISALLAALLIGQACRPHGARADGSPDRSPASSLLFIPNMAQLHDPDPERLAAREQRAAAMWDALVPDPSDPTNCSLAESPCRGDALPSWWPAATHHQRSFLMAALAKDGYPKMENLGVTGDGFDHKCRLAAKWRWLGAEKVRFVDSPLTNIVLLKAGALAFISYRGTWTKLHNDDNYLKWALKPFPAMAPRARVHGGWRDSHAQSWPRVVEVFENEFGCGPASPCEFVAVGHSRGGGLAALAAAALAANHSALGPVREYISLGGVRPGDRVFQTAWDKRFGAITTNWWNRLDWVPRQPVVNAQSPRLRITNTTCPTATSVDNCYTVKFTDARGRPRTRRHCSGTTNTTGAAFDHLEYIYAEAIRNCTGELNLDAACAAWL